MTCRISVTACLSRYEQVPSGWPHPANLHALFTARLTSCPVMCPPPHKHSTLCHMSANTMPQRTHPGTSNHPDSGSLTHPAQQWCSAPQHDSVPLQSTTNKQAFMRVVLTMKAHLTRPPRRRAASGWRWPRMCTTRRLWCLRPPLSSSSNSPRYSRRTCSCSQAHSLTLLQCLHRAQARRLSWPRADLRQ